MPDREKISEIQPTPTMPHMNEYSTSTSELALDESQGNSANMTNNVGNSDSESPKKSDNASVTFSNELCSENTSSSSSTPASFEDILERLGCFGPFQVLAMVSYLVFEIAAAFIVFIPIFEARITESGTRNCTTEYNDTTNNSHFTSATSYIDTFTSTTFASVHEVSVSVTDSLAQSNITTAVESVYNMGGLLDSLSKYESIIEEWDLTCDKAWVPDLFTSCMMAGMMIGNLGTCQLADWYGRRTAYISTLIVCFISTSLSALSPNLYVYAAARFMAGVGFVGIMNISSMTVIEFMTPKWRSFANCIGPMGEGIMLLSLLAYFVRPWRLLYLATLAPYVLIFPIFAFLPESPRWLLRNRKMKEAHAVLGYMAKINRREPVSMEVLDAFRKKEELESESQKSERVTYLEFVRNRTLLVTSLYLFAIWFAWNVSYYGISYNIRNVPGDQYINVGLIGLANAIGQRASMPASDRLGRRKAVLFGMTLSATFLVALAVCFLTIEVTPVLIIITCFIGLLGMACSRGSARLLSGESFPTSVRTMGLGVGGLGANIAGLMTPQVAFLGSMSPSLPFFIFAVISVLGALVVFMMKETAGAPLSDEVTATGKGKCDKLPSQA